MIEHEPDPLRRIPTKHTAEVHAEVGAILRAARLKRGQSLEAVAQQTRIPKRYLEALENDRLDEFPAFVYMRGFLKAYCEHLDVSFDELWGKVQPASVEASPAAPASPAAASSGPAAATPKPATAPPPSHAGGMPRATPTPPASPVAREPGSSATGAILFALTLAVVLGVWLFKDRGPAPAVPQAESTPRALLPLPKTSEPAVGLRAVADAWVRVTVDDKVAFEGRLPRGADMEWKPSRSVSIRTTAPAALQLSVNGAPRPLANPTPDGEYRIEVQ